MSKAALNIRVQVFVWMLSFQKPLNEYITDCLEFKMKMNSQFANVLILSVCSFMYSTPLLRVYSVWEILLDSENKVVGKKRHGSWSVEFIVYWEV